MCNSDFSKNDFFQTAVRLYNHKKFDFSINLFDFILQNNPILKKTDLKIYNYIGLCYYHQHNYNKAIPFFKKQMKILNKFTVSNTMYHDLIFEAIYNYCNSSYNISGIKKINIFLKNDLLNSQYSVFYNYRGKIDKLFSHYQVYYSFNSTLSELVFTLAEEKNKIFKKFDSLERFINQYHNELTFKTSWNIENIDSYIRYPDSINLFLKDSLGYLNPSEEDHEDFIAFSKLLTNLIWTYKYSTFEIILKDITHKIKIKTGKKIKYSNISIENMAKDFEKLNPSSNIKFCSKILYLLSEFKEIRNNIVHEGPQFDSQYDFHNISNDEEKGYFYTHTLLSFVETIGLILLSLEYDNYLDDFISNSNSNNIVSI